MSPDKILKRYHNILKIVAFQIPALILIFWYLAQSNLDRVSAGGMDAGAVKNLRIALSLAALLSLAAIGPVKRWAMTLNPKIVSGDDADKPVITLVSRLYSSSILALGLCEVPAFLGMVLAMQSGNMNDFYLLAALSVVALLVHFPRYRSWETVVRSRLHF